jgi:Secretory lipase
MHPSITRVRAGCTAVQAGRRIAGPQPRCADGAAPGRYLKRENFIASESGLRRILARWPPHPEIPGLFRKSYSRVNSGYPPVAGGLAGRVGFGGVNPVTQPAWQPVLDANNLGTMKPQVPLLQYHGRLDEVIPYSVESTLHTQYCAMGVKSELTGYVGGHVLTQIEAQSQVVSWIGDRFAGDPAPSNC